MKFALVFCVCTLIPAVFGQTAQPGVTSEWDVRKLLQNIDLEAQHLKPVIDQVKPETWTAKGASSSYIAQWKSAQAEMRYFLTSSESLSSQPEKQTLALDTYFRMQSMESLVGSIVEGVRKYQNPALASLIQTLIGENNANRDRLRQYVQDLAAQKEQELQIADKEAQRCRGSIIQQPPKKGGSK